MSRYMSNTLIGHRQARLDPSPVSRRRESPAVQSQPAPTPQHLSSPKLAATTVKATTRKERKPAHLESNNHSRTRRAKHVCTGHQSDTEIWRKLGVELPIIRVSAGHVLFHQGGAADTVYYVGSGKVHRMIATEKGDERLVAMHGPEEFCGEECLTSNARHMTSAHVVDAAHVVRIDREMMSRLLRESPTFAETFTAFLLSRNIKMEAALIDHLVGSVEDRLRHILVTLADTHNGGFCCDVITGIGQETLAALIGASRPRVNYLLNKFRKLGLIEYGGALPRGWIQLRSIEEMQK